MNGENEKKREDNERDIEIITLPDSKLHIFSPPTSIGKTCNYMMPRTPNLNLAGNGLLDTERNGNFTFSSVTEYLGVGGFSKVYKYKGDLENKAVKKIFADPKYYSKVLTAEDSIKREVYGMKKINCENSLKVYGVYQNNEKNTYFLLLELCDGNMDKYIKDRGYPLNIYEVLVLLNQLNKAFYLLDKKNIIHRDIKPSNMLYKEDKNVDPHNKRTNQRIFGGKKFTFKLGDYGVCIPLYNKTYSKSQFMGTLDFMAPEIYQMKCEKEHPIYTKKIDLFSLGQSILVLMGFITKANALNSKAIEELKENCSLFRGNRKEKMMADLVFNYLLIIDPEKRADWNTYFKHQIFEDNNYIQNPLQTEKIADDNISRIENRLIKRKSMDNYKNDASNIKLYKPKKPFSDKIDKKENWNENNKMKEKEEKVNPFLFRSIKKGEKRKNESTMINSIYKSNNRENFHVFNKLINTAKNIDEKYREKMSVNDIKEKEDEKHRFENRIKSISNIEDNFYINHNNNINHNNINNHKTTTINKKNTEFRINEKSNKNVYDINNKNNKTNKTNTIKHNNINKKNTEFRINEKLNNKIYDKNKKNTNINNNNNNNNNNNKVIIKKNTDTRTKEKLFNNYKKNNENPFDYLKIHNNNKDKTYTYKIPKNTERTSKKMPYINKNKNKPYVIKTMPFDLDGVSFEKEKTYTTHKVKKFIANKEDDKLNNNNEKKNNKMDYFDKFINDKTNKTSSIKNITNIIYNGNKSPTFIKNRNKSNIYGNITETKKNDKSFETHNHFYSVRNKYKKLALQKEHNIKTPPINMPVELEEPVNKERYNYKKRRNINISQNISPRNLKRDEENKNNFGYGKESKITYNSYYNMINYKKKNEENDEQSKYNFNTRIKNRNYFLTKNAVDDDMKEKNKDIKYFKLRMSLLPKKNNSRYSKSHMKYNIDKSSNTIVSVTEINQKNPIKINYKNNLKNIKKNYKKNNVTVSEINIKDDISNDLNDNNNNDNNARFTTNEDGSKCNKISYVLNSTNSKNKSITYFNIRVFDNDIQENKNKINKNNAFYFSRYSKRMNNNN